MLADAIRAEGFKLIRNRLTFFFGFLAAPALALVTAGVAQIFTHRQMPPELLAMMPVDMANQIVSAFGRAGEPMTILLAFIGAAVLFAGEYRWETWRLLTPRAARSSWLGAKIAVFAAGALLTVLLIGVAGSLVSWLGAASTGQRMVFDATPGEFAQRFTAFTAVAWFQLLNAGALGALAGVVTRSMIGGMMAPISLSIGLALAQVRLTVSDPTGSDWWKLIAIPGHGFEYARLFLSGVETMPGQTVDANAGLLGLAGVVLWLVVGFGGALLVFSRQDLSKE